MPNITQAESNPGSKFKERKYTTGPTLGQAAKTDLSSFQKTAYLSPLNNAYLILWSLLECQICYMFMAHY